MTFGSLFSGIGGLDLGLERAGMVCRWQVEIDEYCRKVLAKHWPEVPKYGDIRTITDLERVDLIAGGFPCQDVSGAGSRTLGIDGERSGLWSEYIRVVRILRPRYVLVENVPGLLVRGMGRVLGDLAGSGYDAEWGLLSACAMDAPHARERVFLLAYPNEVGRGSWRDRVSGSSGHSHWEAAEGKCEWEDMERWLRENFSRCYGDTPASELQRVDEWFPERLDRCRAVGNAVVPQVAEWIGRRIMEHLNP